MENKMIEGRIEKTSENHKYLKSSFFCIKKLICNLINNNNRYLQKICFNLNFQYYRKIKKRRRILTNISILYRK